MNYDKPKDAASLILFKTVKKKKYLLMGKRPPQQKFMPNIYVFPGGAVEKEDEFVVEGVHKGLNSRYYSTGRFSPTMEKGVHHFHLLLSKAMNS